MPTDHGQTKYMAMVAIICASLFVVNAGFYIMSGSYFDSHREIVAGVSVPSYSPDQGMHVRVMFAVLSGVLGAAWFFAWLRPRVVGHLIPALLGAGHLVAAASAFQHGTPFVLGMTLLVSGFLMPLLAWHSYHRSRPAWAFLIAICGVFAVIEFFGAPKVRGALEIGLWTAMILPGLNAVAVAALVSLRGEYVERAPAAA